MEGKERGKERQEGEEQYGVTGWLLNVNPPRTLTAIGILFNAKKSHFYPMVYMVVPASPLLEGE